MLSDCYKAFYGSNCPLRRGQPFSESWCMLIIQRDHSHWEKQKTHKCGEWACVYTCGIVVEWGYSGAEWGHIHAWGRGGGLCCRGLQASGHQWDAHANSHMDRDSPQCSSITPLFWAIPFSLGWLGIISFPHKKLCKSFHPVWWVLSPLTRIDIYWSVAENPHLPDRERRAAWKKRRGHNKTS